MTGGLARNEVREAVQFLTASFELRPSRRKAAILERRRALAEEIFWDVLSRREGAALSVVQGDRKARRTAVEETGRNALRAALAKGLCEPLAQGLSRDISGQVSSFIELKRTRVDTQWPRAVRAEAVDDTALDRLAAAVTLDEENAARDEVLRCEKGLPLKPLTLARSRDVRILRKRESGSLVVALNILRAKDSDARETVIEAGVDAATGETTARKVTKTCVIVPIADGPQRGDHR